MSSYESGPERVTLGVDHHPAARAEYIDAIGYDERQHAGLGDELVDRFDVALRERSRTTPTPGRGWTAGKGGPELRSHRVETFHYRIVYYVSGERIRVVAYAHTSRLPGYWKDRTGD